MIRCFALLVFISLASAKELLVTDAKAIAAAIKQAKPGDSIVLSAGNWVNTQICFHSEGTKDQPITLMNGIFETDDSGYQQVKRTLLEGNTVLGCKFSLLIGKQYRKNCTAPPIDCMIRNNTFISPDNQLIELRTEALGWKWENNVMLGKSIGIEGLPGVVLVKPALSRPKELTRADTGTAWMP